MQKEHAFDESSGQIIISFIGDSFSAHFRCKRKSTSYLKNREGEERGRISFNKTYETLEFEGF